MVDSKGILNKARADIEARKAEYVDKWKLCNITNAEGRSGGIAEALAGADVCIALSKPGPDTILKEWVAKMAPGSIVFACANPIPEMWPWDAKEAGVTVFATGRSDFPEPGQQQPGLSGHFPRDARRARQDDHGRDVHRGGGRAGQDGRGKGPESETTSCRRWTRWTCSRARRRRWR